MQRREFLKTSAAAALPISSGAYAAASDTIRIGVIGCGGRGTAAAINAMNAGRDIKLVALGDLLMDRVQERLTELKLKKPDQVAVDKDHCFSGFDAYKHVIESADVVLIANAAKFHPLHMTRAIEAGRHVFVEKPHAIDPAGIKAVRAACELAKQKGLSVVSGLHSRYHPGYRETVRRIHDGAIGKVVSLEENFLRAPYVLYPRKPGLTEVEWQGSNQYHFHWLSGDDVPQSLVHNMDRASWVLHDAAPIKCHGMGGRSTRRGEIYGSVFDHHAVVYEFPEYIRVYAFCRTIPECYNESSSIVFGSKGSAVITRTRIGGETRWSYEGPRLDPYDLEHVELFNSIRKGAPVNNGDYMVRSTLIAIMGQISCYTGKEVTWEEINKSDFYFPPRPEDVRADMEPPVKPDAEGNYPVFTPGVTKLL
ncbi:MAG: Gfo/Idh/MocA family oxidoreductase [Bryobacterales bacterium]|nr:Gfo/Idh/MocA family oxidoreductase [Bryobacterales bacterium]